MSEPIRHHFVPQFIIKNFKHNDDKIYYWDKNSQKVEDRNTRSVFMTRNLYRDEKNHPTDPTIIEDKFAKFETEISELFRDKIIDKNPILLTRNENEMLRKFLFLLTFRSSTRKQQYIDANFDDLTKKHLDEYTVGGDYVDLWLREIEMILDLKDFKNIDSNKDISWTIKTDFKHSLSNYYMTFVEARGQDFVIGDVYPTIEIFPIGLNNANIGMHMLFPITPNLMLILNHVNFKPGYSNALPFGNEMIRFSKIKGGAIKPPKSFNKFPGVALKEDHYRYDIQKVYENDVNYLNALALNEVRKGFSFYNYERVINSIKRYQNAPINYEYNKNDYFKLINYYNDSSIE